MFSQPNVDCVELSACVDCASMRCSQQMIVRPSLPVCLDDTRSAKHVLHYGCDTYDANFVLGIKGPLALTSTGTKSGKTETTHFRQRTATAVRPFLWMENSFLPAMEAKLLIRSHWTR